MSQTVADIVTLQDPNSVAPKPRKRRRPKKTTQITEFQDVLRAGIKEPEVKLGEVSSAANAFCTLESLRREILGYGKPKPVDAANTPKSSKARKPAVPLSPA